MDTKDTAATNAQIDPASAESFIAEKRIGERIKRQIGRASCRERV